MALSKGIHEAAEAESTIHGLEAAIRRTGAAAEEVGPRIEKAIQTVFKTSAFDDEPLRRAAQLFVTITGNAEAAANAIGPIADLSAALGMDLESSARLVARATEGQVTGLARAGIIFTDTEKKMLSTADAGTRLAIVMGKINEKVGGAAAAELDTYTGQVQELSRAWAEVAQTFGEIFLPAAKWVVSQLKEIADGIKSVIDAGRNNFANAPANGVAGGITNIEQIAAKGGRAGGRSIISDEDMARLDEAAKRMTAVQDAAGKIGLGQAALEAIGLARGLDQVNDQLNRLSQQQALEKMAPEIEAARQKVAAFAKDARDFDVKVQLALRPPPDNEVEAAVREVEDKFDGLINGAKDKIEALKNDIATAKAQQTSLEVESRLAKMADQIDVAKVTSLNEQIELQDRIIAGATRALEKEQGIERSLERQAPAARQIALDDALAKAAAKALAVYQKVEESVQKIGQEGKAALQGLVGAGGFGKTIDQAVSDAEGQLKLSFGFGPEFRAGVQEAVQKMQKGIVDGAVAGAKEFDAKIRAAFDVSTARFQSAVENIGNVLGDIFTDLFYTGGKNFGEIAGKMFQDAIKGGSQLLAKAIGGAAGNALGGSISRDQYASELEYQTAVQNRTADTLNAAVSLTGLISQLASAGSGVNNPRQNPVGTAVGTTLAGASAGASIAGIVGASTAAGGIIGAIVGLIIGGLMLALAPKVGDSYSYATMGVNKGKAFFDPTQNISDNETKASLAKVQGTFDYFWSGYVDLLSKFPKMKLEGILKDMGTIGPTLGLDNPSGDIGHAANKDFWTQFNNWIEQGMPRDIAAKFVGPLQEGFVSLGLSAGKFQQIWSALDNIDPKAALEALNQLADALTTLGKTKDYFALSGGDLLARGRSDAAKSFTDQLGESDAEILRLGESLNELTGTEQIARLQQIAQLQDQRMQKEMEFIRSVNASIDSVNNSIDSRQRELDLALMKGPDGKANTQAQIDYLKSYADSLLQKIGSAKSPDEVRALESESMSVLARITALGGNTDEYMKWEKDQLETLRKVSVDSLTKMADEVAEQNAKFTDAIDGFIKAFQDATLTLTDLTGNGQNPNNGGNIPTHTPNYSGGDEPTGNNAHGPWVFSDPNTPTHAGDFFDDYGMKPWERGYVPPSQRNGDTGETNAPIAAPAVMEAFSEFTTSSRLQLEATQAQTAALNRMATAIEKGQHIDLGTLTINTNGGSRMAPVVDTFAARQQIARAGARGNY